MVLIRLLDVEQSSFQLGLNATTVASFYQTRESLPESRRTRDYLVERFTEILKMNPWLCGRLVKEDVDGKKNICVSFSEEVSNPLDHIFSFTDDQLFERKQWKCIWEYFVAHSLPKGVGCVNKDEILCKLIIVQNSALTELALVLSLSHSLGDGHTLYYLWRMLDANEDIRRMSAQRDHSFEYYLKRDTNLPNEAVRLPTIMSFGKMLGRGAGRKILGKPAPRTYIYKVNSETIRKRKTECNNDDGFVSTNDILTSWLLGPEVRITDKLSMVINMRGRIPELRDNMAGNYMRLCPLPVSAADDPTTFRDTWTGILTKKQPLELNASIDGETTVNWATLYHQVELDGYTHNFHIPVYDSKQIFLNFAGITLCPTCVYVIFKPNRNETGIMFCVHNDVPEHYFDNCEMLDGKLLS